MMSAKRPSKPLETFVSFPSPYTQSLLVQALVSTIPSLSLSLASFPEDQPPSLQWADYDLLSFDLPHSNPSDYLISSYVYRKALIRKHQLHQTIVEYLAKCQSRGIKSILSNEEGQGGIPQGWIVDIQFADELDEALLDDLYELGQALTNNEEVEEKGKKWFILKPGFADRAQGIRMFSTEDELRDTFESFEPPSSDEEDYNDDEGGDDRDGDGDDGKDVAAEKSVSSGFDGVIDALAKKAVEMGFNGDDDDGDGDDEVEGTGVMTSQLRHFVIQEYLPRPVLFDLAQQPREALPSSSQGHKFHLRAYVLITGGYTVHLSRTMLALFSGSPYSPPSSNTEQGEMDLRPHLTNTCLQTDAYGAPAPPEELVKLFWELEGLSALSYSHSQDYKDEGRISKLWLEDVFAKSGDIVAECVKAGAECGSFGLQFMPNAFEIFGVDLLLSFPSQSGTAKELPIPQVTLLEFNASPDFHQSGDRLRPDLLEMFKGVIRISIAPFFGIDLDDEEEHKEKKEEAEKEDWEVGQEKWGWRLVGKGEVRSGW